MISVTTRAPACGTVVGRGSRVTWMGTGTGWARGLTMTMRAVGGEMRPRAGGGKESKGRCEAVAAKSCTFDGTTTSTHVRYGCRSEGFARFEDVRGARKGAMMMSSSRRRRLVAARSSVSLNPFTSSPDNDTDASGNRRDDSRVGTPLPGGVRFVTWTTTPLSSTGIGYHTSY
jgi:hypothetical protein